VLENSGGGDGRGIGSDRTRAVNGGGADGAKQKSEVKAGLGVGVGSDVEKEICSICLEIVTESSDLQLPCGHWYHHMCVKQLRELGGNDTCPNCRAPLPPGPEEMINTAIWLLVRGDVMENHHGDHAEDFEEASSRFDIDKVNPLYKEAEILLRSAMDLCPSMRAYRTLSTVLLRQHKFEGAIETNKGALALDPEDSAVHSDLAMAHSMLGDNASAISSYKKAISIDSSNYIAHVNLGSCLSKARDFAGAETAFENGISLISSDNHGTLAKMLSSLGDVRNNQHKHDAAIASYKKALAVDPQLASAHSGIGDVMVRQDKNSRAILSYRRAIALEPKHNTAHYNLGVLLHDGGDYSSAVACFKSHVTGEPNDAEAHRRLGLAYVKQSKLTAAISAFKTAVAIDPEFADCYYDLGISLTHERSRSFPDDAISAHLRVLQIDPQRADSHRSIASLSMGAKHDSVAAVIHYSKAIAIDPGHVADHCDLGIVLEMQEKYDDALASFQRAVSIDPADADAQYALAAALYMRQNLVEFPERNYHATGLAYAKAVATDPERTLGHRYIAMIFKYHSQFAAADAAERRCIEIATAENPYMKAGFDKVARPTGTLGATTLNSHTNIMRTSDLCAMKCFGYLDGTGKDFEYARSVLRQSKTAHGPIELFEKYTGRAKALSQKKISKR